MTSDAGAPYGPVPPKRSFDNVPVQIDWHNYLINKWAPGTYVEEGTCIRLPRPGASFGLEYRVAQTGVTGGKLPSFQAVVGSQVSDGSVIWVAQPVSSDSLRSLIQSYSWAADAGVTLGPETLADLVHMVQVSGGALGETYQIRSRIVLYNGEQKEGVALLTIADDPID